VVHGDDGWEESDEAWELGEEEMMIVGTVQQEDDCSWQDACNAWMERDEEATVGVHQVRACQEVVEPPEVGQCKRANATEEGEKALEPDGLLLEGEEQEYFLELLMRKASPERSKASQATKKKAVPVKGKEGKKNRRKEKKTLREDPAGKIADGQVKGERTTSPANSLEKQSAPDPASNPGTKGGGVAEDSREKKERATMSQATSGGECSGQKTPDST
jgi:hypothetical protein